MSIIYVISFFIYIIGACWLMFEQYQDDEKIFIEYKKKLERYIIDGDRIDTKVLDHYKTTFRKKCNLTYGIILGHIFIAVLPFFNLLGALIFLCYGIHVAFAKLNTIPLIERKWK